MTKRKNGGARRKPYAQQKGERPADLLFWFGDGHLGGFKARVAAETEVSIGRTNSKRGLGFVVTNGKRAVVDFVLDRDQVAELAAYLQHCALPGLRKPLGRKQAQVRLASMNSSKHRLNMALEAAAADAHPGWHPIDEDFWHKDAGTPEGAKLIAWFKKTRPRDAARVRQEFIERMLGE
jgi:hypothetical protein